MKKVFPSPPNLGSNWTARVRRVTGNADSAELASRIAAFLYDKKVPRDSVKLRREDWSKDLAMSVRSFERALAVLKSVKYQIVWVKRINFYDFIINEIGFTDRGKKIVFGDMDLANVGDMDLATIGEFYKEEEGKEEGKEEVCYPSGLANASVGSVNKDTGELGMGKTVKEIMSDPPKTKKLVFDTTSGVNTSSLASVWRETHAEVYPGVFQAPFGVKQHSQFKGIMKACPKGLAGKTVDRVVRHWPEFVEAAKLAKGDWLSVPVRPDIGFVLSNIGVAVNMLTELSPGSGVHASSPSEFTQSPKKSLTVSKKVPKPKGQIAGLDEILSKP